MIEHPALAQLKHDAVTARGRCESGKRCPREGWWLTPAVTDKRHFKLVATTIGESAVNAIAINMHP
jgi:hypothetical protein